MDQGGPGRNMYFEGCFGEEDAEAAAQRVALVKERDALRFALKGLHDDVAEYARINHLGGFDNHWMKAARDALGETHIKAQQQAVMQWDPATGKPEPYPSHAAQWREFHGHMTAWLFNPWDGGRRTALDVGSDPKGLLIIPSQEPLFTT